MSWHGVPYRTLLQLSNTHLQLAERTIVEHPITKTGTVEKKEKMGWFVPTSSAHIENNFAVKRRKDLPHHQPIHFVSLDFIPLIYIQTIK